jgi:hypothetical protein
MKTKIFFLKTGYFKSDSYLYDIKIQTDLNENGVEKSVGKSQFQKNVCVYIYINTHKKNKNKMN